MLPFHVSPTGYDVAYVMEFTRDFYISISIHPVSVVIAVERDRDTGCSLQPDDSYRHIDCVTHCRYL